MSLGLLFKGEEQQKQKIFVKSKIISLDKMTFRPCETKLAIFLVKNQSKIIKVRNARGTSFSPSQY